jgi:hypothetical protein
VFDARIESFKLRKVIERGITVPVNERIEDLLHSDNVDEVAIVI